MHNNKLDQYQLYARYSKRMFGICLRYATNHEEAQDILQEGFIRVFQKLPSYKGKGSFEGWIKKIFVHTAIEKYRERVYHLSVDEVINDYGVDAHQNHGPAMLHTRDILNFVQRLPIQYRLVFNLYALEGYNHKEIAEILDISESTSRSNLTRARMILKNKLDVELKAVVRAV
ncbi:MAG: sigma-70 family RNA polymerase sigma factor [Bacteroidales bacterium]